MIGGKAGMSDPLKSLGATVRRERQRRGLSQDHYAALCGLSRAYVGQIERGEVNASFTTLISLAHGLNVQLSEMAEVYERDHQHGS
jgi:transcriptional regulator with XRE-family HTH domain